jgi:hypothetical protein
MRYALLLLASLLVGCPHPSQSYFLGPTAPSQPSPGNPGKAYVYVARPVKYLGMAVGFPILVNGEAQGVLGSRRYVVCEVPAGPVLLEAKAEQSGVVLFEAISGQAYYFELDAKPGWFVARAQLTPLDPSVGAQLAQQLPQSRDTRRSTAFFH